MGTHRLPTLPALPRLNATGVQVYGLLACVMFTCGGIHRNQHGAGRAP
jgi:hypothetical protein